MDWFTEMEQKWYITGGFGKVVNYGSHNYYIKDSKSLDYIGINLERDWKNVCWESKIWKIGFLTFLLKHLFIIHSVAKKAQ